MRTIKKSDKIEALSPKFRDPFVFTLRAPSAMLAYVEDEIRDAGFTTHIKRKGAFKDTLTTTLPLARQLWLACDWEAKPLAAQAIVKAHELVHMNQERVLGTGAYIAQYANARGRWVLEMQAYAVSILAGRALGLDMSGEPKRVAASMWNKYGPWFLFREKAITGPTMAVLGAV